MFPDFEPPDRDPDREREGSVNFLQIPVNDSIGSRPKGPGRHLEDCELPPYRRLSRRDHTGGVQDGGVGRIEVEERRSWRSESSRCDV